MFKKFALVAMITLLPASAMALTAMNDAQMNDVTGQAGVSIAIDGVKMWQTVADVTYTDGDGGANGYVKIAYTADAGKYTSIDALTGAKDTANTKGKFADSGWTGSFTDSPLKIDVVSAATTFAALGVTDTAAVQITLPTLEIKTKYDTAFAQTINIGGTDTFKISVADSIMRIFGGTVEIAGH